MIASAMNREDVRSRLRNAQVEILGLGVRRLALFGSVQRDTARPDSDVDLLVEFQPGQKSYDHFFALGDLLERVLNRSVELVTPESLSPFLKPHILAEATDVVQSDATVVLKYWWSDNEVGIAIGNRRARHTRVDAAPL